MDFSHLPNVNNGAETFILNAQGGAHWQSWIKPRGKSMALFTLIGAGAGGGGGFSGASGSARGGGGGGGSSSTAVLEIPLALLPDTLFATIALGGLGGAPGLIGGATNGYTILSISPTMTLQDWLLYDSAANAGPGGPGTAAGAGAAGTAGSSSARLAFAYTGLWLTSGGVNGGIGGLHTGQAGATPTWGSVTAPLSGGGGGAGVGVANTDFAGGGITGGGWFPSLAGGLVAGGHGNAGFQSLKPFGMCGGSGGGSNGIGTGGDGGDGGIGCGGGGGGGGVTGGSGGRGGNGLIIITCW